LARKKKSSISEKDLTKGELRKLNALRKSLGDDIAEEAFAKWYEQSRTSDSSSTDPNVEVIEQALSPHLGDLRFPRSSGYLLRRGRGRIIVERLDS